MQTACLPHRRIMHISGGDCANFLQRILTLDIEKLASKSLNPTALLTPQGKVMTAFLIGATDEGYVFDMPIEGADEALKQLNMLKLRADVKFETKEEITLLATDGEWKDSRHDNCPRRSYCAPTNVNVKPISESWDDLRIALGLAEMGKDYAPSSVFPTDMNIDVLGGLAFDKGCFVGQEVASRMKRRGNIRRRTLIIEGETLQTGVDLFKGNANLGQTMSVNSSQTQGLAMMRVDRLGDATHVQTKDGQVIFVKWPDYLTVYV